MIDMRDARLGAAIKALARMPGDADRRIRFAIESSAWTAVYELRLLAVTPKRPAGVQGFWEIQPTRSAPGDEPAPDGGAEQE